VRLAGLLIVSSVSSLRKRHHKNTRLNFTASQQSRATDFGIDTMDPAYYTVANGNGQTTAPSETDIDVGGDARPTTECGAPVLRAAQSDFREGGLRWLRRGPLPAILRRRDRPA
jgi:hypothetical protein